jgi:hypothetical protein
MSILQGKTTINLGISIKWNFCDILKSDHVDTASYTNQTCLYSRRMDCAAPSGKFGNNGLISKVKPHAAVDYSLELP